MPIELNEQQKDCFQEISNIAVASAAEVIGSFLGQYLELSVPTVRLIPREKLMETLETIVVANDWDSNITASHQEFSAEMPSGFFSGEAVLIYDNMSLDELSRILQADDEVGEEDFDELLLETSNIINCASLNEIGSQLDVSFNYNAPAMMARDMPTISDLFDIDKLKWDQVLAMNMNFSQDEKEFIVYCFFMIPDSAIEGLIVALDEFWNKMLGE